jgi:general secretion pathway protein M
MQSLSLAQQRLFAVLLLIALLVGLSAAVYIPWKRAHAHYDEAYDTAVDKITRYQRAASIRTDQLRALESLKGKDASRFFLKNTAPNLAGDELQGLVRTAIESNGGRINSIQIGQVREEYGYRVYSVNVMATLTAVGLQKAAYALESKEPFVFADNFIVRSPLYPGAKPAGKEPEYSVQIDASAFAPGLVSKRAGSAPSTATASTP